MLRQGQSADRQDEIHFIGRRDRHRRRSADDYHTSRPVAGALPADRVARAAIPLAQRLSRHREVRLGRQGGNAHQFGDRNRRRGRRRYAVHR